jgi:hypothetical protein
MSHLTPEERQEAVEMLVFIGIMTSQLPKIDIHLLRQTYGKFKSFESISPKNLQLEDVHRTMSHRPDPKSRAFRLNSMAAYPFTDDYGTVRDILDAQVASIPLREMGAPARARVIQVTYNSMLNGRKHMKISDIPEALAVYIRYVEIIYLSILTTDLTE